MSGTLIPHSSLTPERLAELEAARDGWLAWAESEQRAVDRDSQYPGVGCPPTPQASADTGRNAARSIELEIETGIPHCCCCLKPLPKDK